MEPAFSIVANHTTNASRVLMVELAQWGITYVIADTNKVIHELYVFHFPTDVTADKAAVLIKQSAAAVPSLHEPFSRATIVYQYPEAVLVPQIYLQQQYTRELLELSAGNINDATILKDYVQKEQLYVIFAIPRIQESVVNYLFQADRVTHGFVQLLNGHAVQPGNYLQCIFGNNAFVLHLVKDGKFCLLQHYHFKAPEDVVYLLLKACEVHQLDARELTVVAAGMITVDSAVYNSLMKYFLQFHFAVLPEGLVYPEAVDEYPAHYFSHIFQMLLCEL